MTVSLKHAFTSPKSDGTDPTLVQPSNWNAEHTLTCAANSLLGRTTTNGAVQEITCTAFARTFLDDTDAATARTTLGAFASTGGTIAGAVTVTGDITVSKATPILTLSGSGIPTLRLYESDAAQNSKYSEWYSQAGVFACRFVNDAYNAAASWISVTRNTNSHIPATVNLYTGTSSTALALQVDSTRHLKFDSGYGSAANAYGCRAWGAITGSTGAVRAGSAGFTCTHTPGTGIYNISFPAMPDTNYAVTATCEDSAAFPGNLHLPIVLRGTRTTTGFQIRVNGATNVAVDPDSLFISIHR